MKFLLPILLLSCSLSAQLPTVSSGKLSRFVFPNDTLGNITVDIWQPDSYRFDGTAYSLYMQDGQQLFDSSLTWNKQEWGVDETIHSMITANPDLNVLVVAVHNTPKRRQWYSPKAPLLALPTPLRDSIFKDIGGIPISDTYAGFIAQVLKPFVDSTFRPSPQKQHTFLVGSSSGALISWYTLVSYPNIFGGAACLSTHWTNSVFRTEPSVSDSLVHYLYNHIQPDQLLYTDRGTIGLDSTYQYGAEQLEQLMRFHDPQRFTSNVFKGDAHTEKDWKRRLSVPLHFLFRLKN